MASTSFAERRKVTSVQRCLGPDLPKLRALDVLRLRSLRVSKEGLMSTVARTLLSDKLREVPFFDTARLAFWALGRRSAV